MAQEATWEIGNFGSSQESDRAECERCRRRALVVDTESGVKGAARLPRVILVARDGDGKSQTNERKTRVQPGGKMQIIIIKRQRFETVKSFLHPIASSKTRVIRSIAKDVAGGGRCYRRRRVASDRSSAWERLETTDRID